MDRIPTGSATLDVTLDGGLVPGSLLLLEGPRGVGSTEFALTLLRCAGRTVRRAVFATALRSPASARAEAVALFGGDLETVMVDFLPIRRDQALADCGAILATMGEGDVLAIESTSALSRSSVGRDLPGFLETVASAASERRVVVLVLHSSGTLADAADMTLGEIADGIFTFGWRDGGSMRRRCLFITKLRGLASGLGGDQLPVFETALTCGPGFTLSRVRSLA